jgi:hypothetical protein
VAYKCASNYRDGSNCNRLELNIDWHIVGSIAIGLDHTSIGIDGGFNGVFNGGLFD